VTSRRARVLSVPWLLFAGAIGIVTASWISLKSLEQRRWKRLEQRVSQLGADLDARCGPRPILRGTPIPGDAWDDYLPAIDLASKMEEYSMFQMFASSSGEPDFERYRVRPDKYLSAVQGMQRGTRRAESRRVRLHEKEAFLQDWGGTWLQGAVALGYVSGCRARCLAAEGKTHDATELLLDLLKYGQDVAADGSELAHELSREIMSSGLVGIEYLLIHGKVSTEDCRQMSEELGRLDGTFPRLGPVLLCKLEYFGSWMLSGQGLDDLRGIGCVPRGSEIEPGWREAYSRRLMLVAIFDRTDDLVAGLLATDLGTSSDEVARRSKVYLDLGETRHWLFKAFTGMFPDSRPLRHLRTRVRLLRVAAHYRASGDILELDDPLGTKLLHKVEPDQMRFWGVGNNGKDDGGDGSSSDDIIVVIPRRP
jgi:hypothetical protein